MKYSNLAPLGLIIVLMSMACAGNPGSVLQWSHILDEGAGYSAQQTVDGGYILYGPTIMKLDTSGNMVWNKAFNHGWGFLVQQTEDTGYIACGYDNNQNIWMVKTDINGNQLWDKIFGNEQTRYLGQAIQQTSDSGYIVCGATSIPLSSHHDIWLMKTDSNGNKLWDKTFGDESDDDVGFSVQETTDEGYIVCGEADISSEGSGSAWLIKTDAKGNRLWDRIFDGEPYLSYYVRSVQQTSDGGYIISGTEDKQSIKPGSYNAWLMKTDAEGNTLWDKTWGVNKDTSGHMARQTMDGGYVICGTTPVRRFWLWSESAIWLIKTDADGNKLWDETFSGNGQANGNSVQQTADGGYIVCGDTWSEGSKDHGILLLKIAPER